MSIRYQGDDLKQYKVQVEEEDVDGLPVDLGLHLVARHADPVAVDREEGDNEAHHHREHTGPGTVRHHDEGDLSYDAARAVEILARHQEGTREEDDKSLSEETFLALHLASAHHDDQAFFRTMEQNLAAHKAIPAFMHQHTGVQHRYELVLAQKIEADLGDGTMLPWCPVPHPPHEVADLARMIGSMHDRDGEMPADLIAFDLAWIKTTAWPWHRRLLAAFLLVFPPSRPPSGYLGRRDRKAIRK